MADRLVTLQMTGGPICSLNAPVGQWHTLRALENGTVIQEKEHGAYEAIGTGM